MQEARRPLHCGGRGHKLATGASGDEKTENQEAGGRNMFGSGHSMKIRKGLVILFAGAALAACSNVPDPQTVIPDASSYSDTSLTPAAEVLNAGDSIKIIAFGADDLPGDYKLAANGQLDLGRYGKVDASGLTPRRLEEVIAARLAEKGHPGVRVSVMRDAG